MQKRNAKQLTFVLMLRTLYALVRKTNEILHQRVNTPSIKRPTL